LATFSRVIELKPDYWQAWTERAVCYEELKQWDNAAADWSKAIEVAPKQVRAALRLRRAAFCAQGGQVDAAIQEAEELAKNADLDTLYAAACVVAMAADRAEEPGGSLSKEECGKRAVALLRQAVAKGYNDAEHMKKSDALKGLREREDFRELLEALAAVPRARHHVELGEWHEAIADLNKTIELNPKNPAALDIRGMAYVELGQWQNAAADYDKLLELQPANGYVWFENAYLRLKRGDTAGYWELCRRMLEQFGQSKEVDDIAMLAHTWVLAAQRPGDAERARQLAERRLSITTEHPIHKVWSVHILGLAYYRAGMNDKAVECLAQGVKDYPDWEHNVFNWLVLAMAHHQLKHEEEVRQWLDKSRQRIEQKKRSMPEKYGGFAPPGWAWRDWLGVQMLREEAEELLGAKAEEK
jgi:tetratricopeptide (TPR) repeat protein